MVKLSQCLADLGITDASTFDNCDNVEDEIKVIKKIYFKLVLIQHPVSKQKIGIRPHCCHFILKMTKIL